MIKAIRIEVKSSGGSQRFVYINPNAVETIGVTVGFSTIITMRSGEEWIVEPDLDDTVEMLTGESAPIGEGRWTHISQQLANMTTERDRLFNAARNMIVARDNKFDLPWGDLDKAVEASDAIPF